MLMPGDSQPAATQAEEAQGMVSAQEQVLTHPEAPMAETSSQSQAIGTGATGRGRGRGRGRGKGSSSRPAVDRTSSAVGEKHSCFTVFLAKSLCVILCLHACRSYCRCQVVRQDCMF